MTETIALLIIALILYRRNKMRFVGYVAVGKDSGHVCGGTLSAEKFITKREAICGMTANYYDRENFPEKQFRKHFKIIKLYTKEETDD